MMCWDYFVTISGLIWLVILLLPWRPWGTQEALDSPSAPLDSDLSDITILIPARNEAHLIGAALSSLRTQGSGFSVIVVDDQSTDETASVAKASGIEKLRIISGEFLPEHWSGKVWALEQGFRQVDTPLTLLLDADIQLGPGILAALKRKLKENSFQLVSLMAHLKMAGFWERLLMPAFVYFFKMLYPFRLSNSRFTGVAAAAGGCILMETRVIREIGGFHAIRNELIDDCALAKRVKRSGYRIWIGLTHSVCSLRSYDDLAGIWSMVARTGFCQLHYSAVLLLITTVMMLLVFWLPVAGLFFPAPISKIVSTAAFGASVLSYLPTLRFYKRSSGWAITLPLIGTLYLAMTWSSAIRFWLSEGTNWKGRFYKGGEHPNTLSG